MDAWRELLLSDPDDVDGATVRHERRSAGLTVRQAAKILGISAVELSRIEQGVAWVDDGMAAKMREVYGVGRAAIGPTT